MQQRLLYRLEDAEGRGPFNARETWGVWDDEPYNDRVRFPSPENDHGFDQEKLWETIRKWNAPSVGCCSRSQLQYWFDAAACRTLAALGFAFTVWRMNDDRVIEGKFQAVFDRLSAKCLERHPADALWADQERIAA